MTSSSLKILIADDNVLNQTLLLQMLQYLGYEADSANNGVEVLAALETQMYDLVLMDVKMPKMDGLATTRAIRTRCTAEISPQIIGMTGLALPEEQQECLNSGMDACLCKPIRLEKLSEVLSRCLSRSQQERYPRS